MSKALEFKLKNAPKKPGVYIFKNKKEEILYIGKAKNLFKRANSYFQKEHADLKTSQLVARIAAVEFMVTDNELEALILELNLIKKHRPAFNIDYKDDKSYPYIAITLDDEFPRISITREAHKKGVKYFGPYVSAGALRQTLDTLRSIFLLRTCRNQTPGRKSHRQLKGGKITYSPCLNYHIDKCLAPCSNQVSPQDYRQVVKQVVDFLEGRGASTLKLLKAQMKAASDKNNFEKAARLRDRIRAAQAILDKQNVAGEDGEDLDIFGTAFKDGYAAVALFMVRGGKLLGSESFCFGEKAETEPLLSFIKHYYHATSFIPKEVLVNQELSDTQTLELWLKKLRKANVHVKKPLRGRKKRLVELASKNAEHNLDFHLKKLEVESEKLLKALKELEKSLDLTAMPYRIECFDISNISGTSATGSMVVFENGKPKKAHYRKFKVRFDEGINDCQMLAEVVARRLKSLTKSDDKSFAAKPDLILVDGGKGQLSAAKSVLGRYFGNSPRSISQGTVPAVASLAKREEELFIPSKSQSINLNTDSPALKLVQQIRDEAHRFAIQYHRLLRSKKMLM